MLPYALPDNGMELIENPCRRNGLASKFHEELTGPAERIRMARTAVPGYT